MPHGGYHGVVKVGDKIVQQGSPAGAPVGQGGVYNPDGFATEMAGSSAPSQSDLQIVQNQAQNIKNIQKQFENIDDNRSKFLALQTPQRLLTEAQKRRIQNRRRAEVLDALKLGKNVDRSLFTGRVPKEGTKSSILNAFGIGTVPTGRPKLREGLSSAEYADFMRQAYQANPGMIESLFPFQSGKMIRNVSRLLPGIGTIQNIASLAKEKTGGFLNRFFPGLLPSSGIATTKQAQPTLAELAENAFRFASFRTAPTNINDIKASRSTNFSPLEQIDAVRGFKSLRGTAPFPTDLEQFFQIRDQSKTPPDIDVSMEGIAPLDAANVLKNEILFGLDNNQTGSTAPLLGNASIAQQKEFFENAIRGNVAGVPDRIGQIYQNLLDSGALSSSEALQYGSFVRNLPPPSNTYGLNPNIKPGIEGINLQGNFPGVL